VRLSDASDLSAGHPVRYSLQQGDELFLVGEMREAWLGPACGCSKRRGHVSAKPFDAVFGYGRASLSSAGFHHCTVCVG